MLQAAENQICFPFPTTAKPKRMRRKRRAPVSLGYQLLLSLDDQEITPLMQRVEATLTRLARARDQMPSYETLSSLVQAQSRSGAFRALHRLQALGRLRLEQTPERRRVVILFSGAATEWAPRKPGKAPYSAKKKSKRFKSKSKNDTELQRIKIAPARLPKMPSLGLLPPPVTGPRSAIQSANECQNPLWGYGDMARDEFCGAKTLPGKSWCAACYSRLTINAKSVQRACV